MATVTIKSVSIKQIHKEEGKDMDKHIEQELWAAVEGKSLEEVTELRQSINRFLRARVAERRET